MRFGDGLGQGGSEGKRLKGLTPLQVADNLDTYALTAVVVLPGLREQAGGNVELRESLRQKIEQCQDVEALRALHKQALTPDRRTRFSTEVQKSDTSQSSRRQECERTQVYR